MSEKSNEMSDKGKKKHNGIKIAVIVVALVIIVECCFNTNDYTETDTTSATSDETEKKESSDNKEVKTETAETETTQSENTELKITSEEISVEDMRSAIPGVSYVTYEGGSASDEELYLNLINEGNAVRYVGFSYDEGELRPEYNVDVVMYQVDDTTWVSDDNLWKASYLTDETFYFGQQENNDSDFMGTFGRITADSASASSQEVLTFTSDSEMRDFLRDDSNIGKTVTFDAYVMDSLDDVIFVYALWSDGSKSHNIAVSNSNASVKILNGDYITFTGVYKGFNDLNKAYFDTISIELMN